jgi:TonB family protein
MNIQGAITNSLALILLFCFLSPAPERAKQATGQADGITIFADSPVRTFSGSETKELKRKLLASAEGNIKALEADNAPLAISETRARGVKIEGNHDASSGSPPPINDYVVQLSVTLVNRESRPITGLGVEFANAQSNSLFYVYRHPVDIGVNRNYRLDIGFMAVTGDPSELAVRLVGVRFADQTVWGSFPLFPPNAPRRLSQSAPIRDPGATADSPAPEKVAEEPRYGLAPNAPPEASQRRPPSSGSQVTPRSADESGIASSVDSKPKLLNQPTPRYTEQARMNGVMGVVKLRALIWLDGSVKRVNVVRALPDGLTEEAIRCAFTLKFEPARRNDQPVAFVTPVEIHFNFK